MVSRRGAENFSASLREDVFGVSARDLFHSDPGKEVSGLTLRCTST